MLRKIFSSLTLWTIFILVGIGVIISSGTFQVRFASEDSSESAKPRIKKPAPVVSVKGNLNTRDEKGIGDTATDVFSDREICRAVISVVMDQTVGTIEVASKDENEVRLSYTRPSDSSTWQLKCQAYRTKAVWGTADGRYRTHTRDPDVTFRLSDSGALLVGETYQDGTRRGGIFTKKTLGGQ